VFIYNIYNFVCVCVLITFVSSAKTAESIEMPFGGLTRMGSSIVSRGGSGNFHLGRPVTYRAKQILGRPTGMVYVGQNFVWV